MLGDVLPCDHRKLAKPEWAKRRHARASIPSLGRRPFSRPTAIPDELDRVVVVGGRWAFPAAAGFCFGVGRWRPTLLSLATAFAMLLPLLAIWRAPAAVAAGTTVTLSTVASATITVGGAVADTAILSGGSGPNGPTGTISFSIFGPGDTACSTAVATSTVTVAGDGSYASTPFIPVEPGTYQWVATYSGDADNAGASEPCATPGESVFVRQAAPTLTTQASGSSGAGYAITDIATLSGGTRPTGLIVFSVFGSGDTTCASPLATSTATVSGDGP